MHLRHSSGAGTGFTYYKQTPYSFNDAPHAVIVSHPTVTPAMCRLRGILSGHSEKHN